MARNDERCTDRRTALEGIAAVGGAGLTGLAGCVSLGGSGGSSGESSNTSGGPGSSSEETTLKLAYSANQRNALHKGAEMLAETVEEKSDGRLKLDLICCQKAGGPPQIMKSTQQGTMDMGFGAVNNLAGLTNAWNFCQLPYLWKDHQSMYDFWNEADVIAEVNAKAKETLDNVLIKSYFGSGGGSFRHLHVSSDSRFEVPSGTNNQKMRVTESPVEKATVGNWGFSPSPIAWSETVSAMKQGIVEGIHIHYWWLFESGMYQSINYTVETFTQDSPSLVYINKNAYNRLPSDLQEILDESIEEVTPKQLELDIEQGKTGKREIEESGVEIYSPTKSELRQWQMAASETYDEMMGTKGIDEKFVKAALDFQNYSPPGVDL